MPLKKMQKRRYLLLHIFWKHLALVLLPPLKRWLGNFFSILFYFKHFYIFIFFFSDEENDAKLWTDIVESIKDWQQSKVIKIQQRNRGLHRSVLFFNFTNLLQLNFPQNVIFEIKSNVLSISFGNFLLCRNLNVDYRILSNISYD